MKKLKILTVFYTVHHINGTTVFEKKIVIEVLAFVGKES